MCDLYFSGIVRLQRWQGIMSEFPDLKVFARSVKPHGWRKELLVPSVELETKLTMLSCFICKSVLMKAVMASCCGSRFCEECIEFSQRSGISACPKCGEELETYTDSRVRKMIDQLQAYCINKPECAEQGKIGDLINHVVQCPYGVGDCPFGCDEAMLRKDFSAHERVCEKKLLPCKYCKVKVHESLQAEHWERSCTKRPLKCKYCGTELSRNKLTEHVLAKHKAEYEKEYVQLNEEFKRSYETHKTALEKLSQISQSELDVAFSELQQRLMYAGASGPFKDMIEASLAATSDRTELTKVMDLLKDEDTREIQKLDTYIHDFEQRIAAVKLHLDRSFQKLLENDESTGDEKLVDGLKSDIEQTKKQLIVQTDFFDAVEKDVQFLEVSSKDGVFVWKLEKWTEVLHKAKKYVSFLSFISVFSNHLAFAHLSFACCNVLFLLFLSNVTLRTCSVLSVANSYVHYLCTIIQ